MRKYSKPDTPNTMQSTTSVSMMLSRGIINSLSLSIRNRPAIPRTTATTKTINPVRQSANTKLKASSVGVNVPDVVNPTMFRKMHVTRAPRGISRISERTRCISKDSRVRSRISRSCCSATGGPERRCGQLGNRELRLHVAGSRGDHDSVFAGANRHEVLRQFSLVAVDEIVGDPVVAEQQLHPDIHRGAIGRFNDEPRDWA